MTPRCELGMNSPAARVALSVLLSAAFFFRAAAESPDPQELAAARIRYQQEVAQAVTPIKQKYALTLEGLKKALGAKGDAAGALAVQQEIDRLGVAQPANALRPDGAKVVIYNQHNAGFNDRGAKKINVALITNEKEVWRQNDIAIPWEAGKDTSVSVDVPAVPTDRIRVEVTDSINGSGGLAEIEYWHNGHNLAKKRRVKVSAVWENNPKCGGDTLTDGITTSKDHQVGYWLIPNGLTGWAEVSLNVRD